MLLKSRFYCISVFLLLSFTAFPTKTLPQNEGYKVKRVVIDPGHGGKDPGGLGTGRYKTTESDIVLKVGLKLREYINQHLPEVEVIMTRETDVFLKLIERTKIANEAEADLFISIHCNTNGSSHAHGSETYVLGMHKTEANMEVAKRENKVIFLEENYEENYEGFDPRSPESMIALSMMQREHLDQSILMAGLIQEQFRERVSRRDRGVKQAGYWVISRTIMPSVLVELGFITNSPEEDFLNSENGIVYMASAIFRAFKEYKNVMEEGNADELISESTGESPVEQRGEDTSRSEPESPDALKRDTAVEDETGAGSGREENDRDKKSLVADDKKPIFRVQIASSAGKINDYANRFADVEGVDELKQSNSYKYVAGQFENPGDAARLQNEIREKGYEGAFVIATVNGERIPLREAVKLMEK